MAFACKMETLGSLYSHALLMLTRSSKFKNQVVHKKKIKDPLSSTCLSSSERSVLESEVMRDPGGNILSLVSFFSRSTSSDANIGILV